MQRAETSGPSDTPRPVRVGDREIGHGRPVFVIAEAGVNHNGDERLAHQLVDVAAEARADAVKFQTFEPAALVRRDAAKARYQQRSSPRGSQRQMLEGLALDPAAQMRVAAHARERGLVFLSTPFDERSVDVVVRLGVPAIKVSSGDLTSVAFLREVGRKGLPVLLSTGMGTVADVREGVEVLRSAGATEIVLLHCVSAYPASPAEANLRAMATLRHEFGVPVGYSDHTEGLSVPLAAVALGACVIEKHFTLDRGLPGPDHSASAGPHDLSTLVREIRTIESALGSGEKVPTPGEQDARSSLRKSVVTRRALTAGTVLDASALTLMRPADGLPPRYLDQLIGRRLVRDLAAEEPIRLEDVE